MTSALRLISSVAGDRAASVSAPSTRLVGHHTGTPRQDTSRVGRLPSPNRVWHPNYTRTCANMTIQRLRSNRRESVAAAGRRLDSVPSGTKGVTCGSVHDVGASGNWKMAVDGRRSSLGQHLLGTSSPTSTRQNAAADKTKMMTAAAAAAGTGPTTM